MRTEEHREMVVRRVSLMMCVCVDHRPLVRVDKGMLGCGECGPPCEQLPAPASSRSAVAAVGAGLGRSLEELAGSPSWPGGRAAPAKCGLEDCGEFPSSTISVQLEGRYARDCPVRLRRARNPQNIPAKNVMTPQIPARM